MACAECGGEGEDIGSGCASGQAANIRLLNRGAIGHWIGKRHTELNHIRTARDQRIEISGGVAIASSDEGDECGVGFGKGGGETGHIAPS